MHRVAVVGGGIAGLGAAWLIGQRHHVTLFEAGDYFGGHSNTVDVTLEGRTAPVDTGFLVHNTLTYPLLVKMFEHLGVPTRDTDMSFAVSLERPELEWAGTNLATVFAQRRNLLRPAFLRMLRDILRFNRMAPDYLAQARGTPLTLGELLAREGYGAAVRDWYLLPMAAAIWSSSVAAILDFPAQTFLTFCLNHRLLQVNDRPQWRTVAGGSREYVRRLVDALGVQSARHTLRVSTPVESIARRPGAVWLHSKRHGTEKFDAVVLACHSDQALALLSDASPLERELLGAVRYAPNEAWLHTDRSLLPRRESTWSAWNFMAAEGQHGSSPVAVSYWLNRLQDLPFQTPVIVTLNPPREPAAASVLGRYAYAHPQFDRAAVEAQRRLPTTQGDRQTWFCGAWTGYGFHEDGLRSAVDVARDFGVQPPWESAHG